MYAMKLNTTVTESKPSAVLELDHIHVVKYTTESKTVVGYTISLSDAYDIAVKEWYLSAFRKETSKHTNPRVVYNDQQVFVTEFNTKTYPNYWVTFREKA
jgi:hypothetical protein